MSEALSNETILVTDEGHVRTITLNRPDSRNALNPQMQQELIAAMEDADSSPCRVVVFCGAGSAFCSGLDLSVLQTMTSKSADQHRADAAQIAKLFRTLYEMQKPTIAAVQGPAIAGGTGLATICDFTLAAPAAKFGYTEVRIGFIPALVSVFLSIQIGDKRSRDLLLTGRLFDATEAHHLGLVNEVVAPEELDARVQSLAATLATNSPQSIAATKRLLVTQQKAWLDTAIADALAANAEGRLTTDFAEGVTSFLEKRKPTWTN